MSTEPTDDEKITAYRIARNFQDRPKTVLQKLREEFGKQRLMIAINWLESVASKGTNENDNGAD